MSSISQSVCLNCNAALVGPYCAQCGQRAGDHSKSLGRTIVELLESLFHFDGRVQRTIGLMLVKPGEAPRRWNAGRRAGLVPPIRLYLFVSLLFFLAMSWTDLALIAFVPEASGPQTESEAGSPSVELRVLMPMREVEQAERALFAKMKSDAKVEISATPPGEIDSPAARERADKFKRTWEGYLNEPTAFNKALEEALPKLMFCFLPIGAFVFWLATPGRRHFVDHLAVSLYLHSFLFMALLVPVAIRTFGPRYGWDISLRPVGLTFAAILPLYVALTMRRAYGLSIIGSVLRGLLALVLYGVNFALFSLPILLALMSL